MKERRWQWIGGRARYADDFADADGFAGQVRSQVVLLRIYSNSYCCWWWLRYLTNHGSISHRPSALPFHLILCLFVSSKAYRATHKTVCVRVLELICTRPRIFTFLK